jgi:hypothetical protein
MKKANQNQSKDNNDFDPKDSETKDLARKAFAAFIQNQIKESSSARKNTDALVNTVQEFLNSFIILGYTMDGQPVNFIFAHNQQEADSLATLLNKFFMKNVKGEPGDAE